MLVPTRRLRGRARLSRRPGRLGIAALALVAALGIGLAACGDDEGDTGTGSDESAIAQFCSSLDDFDMALEEAGSLTPSSSSDELGDANQAVGGAVDQLGLAAQGAGVDTSALSSAAGALAPLLQALQTSPTAGNVEMLRSALGPVERQVSDLQQSECPGEGTTTG